MTDIRFTDLTLTEPVLSALEEMGYEHPTPVQASAIPLATAGRDLMVQSQTGTGKTAAFGIPLIENLEESKGIQALVLCPTRELAKQVADEFTRIGQFKRVQPVAVYGGASIEKQIAELKFSQVVVGTPGRVLDHLRRGTARFGNVKTLVLDEADEMLSMGFAQELEQIMRFVPEERQTLLFSATIPPDIKRYAKRYMNEPEFLSLVEENVGADDIDHHYYMVSGVGRSRDLVRVIQYEDPNSAIIFTNTRKDCEVVTRALKRAGMSAEYLNGDLSQKERERVLSLMKDKALRFLVATDIAARGIDISQLSHVINYQLPESAEVYIHRTGRTGRAGASGTALSLIGPREIGVYYYLKRIYQVNLEEMTVPSKTEIDLRRSEAKIEELVAEITGSLSSEEIAPETKALAARLLEREQSAELVQILLTHFKKRNQTKAAVGNPVGGLLKDVPKPEHIAPGSRRPTLAGIADRVATIRGEYRGLPGEGANQNAEASSGTSSKPAVKASPKTTDDETSSVSTSAEDAPKAKRRSSRRASSKDSTETTTSTAEESGAASDEEKPPRKPRRSRREASGSKEVKEAHVAGDASEQSPEEADPPPRRTRRSRRSAGTSSDSQPAASVSTESEDADSQKDAPKRSRRRRRDDEPTSEVREAEEPARSSPPVVPEGMKRLYLNVGSRSRVDESGVRELIADLAGLFPEDLVDVSVFARHSFVTVEDEFAEDLLEAVNGESFKGRTIRVEYARD